MNTQTCDKCEITKPVDEFYLSTNGKSHRSTCKDCCRKRDRDNYKARKKHPTTRHKVVEPTGFKKECTECNRFKDQSEFHKNKSTRDGYHTKCKVCRLEQWEAYAADVRAAR